ncbi:MAG: hypothetical protein GXO98_02650 [Nitrospirae bacterium]|nr:hypothetical protein [Nitrospirota bacterium]
MDSKLNEATDGFVESIGQLGASLGLNRVAAQLYALLFMSNEPLSLDDMVEKLGVSKGNVSVNVRELEKWGAARKVWVKGNRKDFYVAELDIFKVITDRLRVGLNRRMEEALEAIKGAEEAIRQEQRSLNGEDEKRAKAVRNRLREAKETYWRVNSLISTAFKIIS